MNVNDFENEVREKLKTVFPTVNWEFTSNPMAVFDAYAHIDGKVLTAEIKCRQHKGRNNFSGAKCNWVS